MLGMIKIGEAARRLGITATELRDSAHRGEIKSTRTPGGVHYFCEQDLEEFAQKRSQTKPAKNGLRIGEVAKMFDLPVATIAGWADRGYLGYTKTSGGTRLFPVDEVETLLKKMRGEPDEDAKNVSGSKIS